MAPAAMLDDTLEMHYAATCAKTSTVSASVLHGPRDLRMVRVHPLLSDPLDLTIAQMEIGDMSSFGLDLVFYFVSELTPLNRR